MHNGRMLIRFVERNTAEENIMAVKEDGSGRNVMLQPGQKIPSSIEDIVEKLIRVVGLSRTISQAKKQLSRPACYFHITDGLSDVTSTLHALNSPFQTMQGPFPVEFLTKNVTPSGQRRSSMLPVFQSVCWSNWPTNDMMTGSQCMVLHRCKCFLGHNKLLW